MKWSRQAEQSRSANLQRASINLGPLALWSPKRKYSLMIQKFYQTGCKVAMKQSQSSRADISRGDSFARVGHGSTISNLKAGAAMTWRTSRRYFHLTHKRGLDSRISERSLPTNTGCGFNLIFVNQPLPIPSRL